MSERTEALDDTHEEMDVSGRCARGSVFGRGMRMACVGCREPGSETIAKESPTVLAGWAFSWSVLFMLVFVFAIVGGMSLYIWQTCRRLEREAALRVSGG